LTSQENSQFSAGVFGFLLARQEALSEGLVDFTRDGAVEDQDVFDLLERVRLEHVVVAQDCDFGKNAVVDVRRSIFVV
jgi:hypothetical protein